MRHKAAEHRDFEKHDRSEHFVTGSKAFLGLRAAPATNGGFT
jgi:hypothetical protein